MPNILEFCKENNLFNSASYNESARLCGVQNDNSLSWVWNISDESSFTLQLSL